MYDAIARMAFLYGRLQDELSKSIFRARLRADLEQTERGVWSAESVKDLNALYQYSPDERLEDRWDSGFLKAVRGGAAVVLYGTRNHGRQIASRMLADGLDFYGFCGRGADRFPDGLMGKPVFPPERLPDLPDVHVVQAVKNHYGSLDAVSANLKKLHIPEDHIWDMSVIRAFGTDEYFEFFHLFTPGTAFVDGGVFDGRDCIRFARFCRQQFGGSPYSRIFAFEPDPQNYPLAEQALHTAELHGVSLIPAGLSDTAGEASFVQDGTSSGLLDNFPAEDTHLKTVSIRTVTLDETVKDETVGMIKLDIEGSEYAALRGAERTIRRDRPLLAVCVYHKRGDTSAIMDLLADMVPEYRFWLRQYEGAPNDTVLYAAVRDA